MSRSLDLRSAIVGGFIAGLVMTALPALSASVGDPLQLGVVNVLDARTDLKGKAKGANVQVKNTGQGSAVVAKAKRQAIKAKATAGPVGINVKADRVGVKIRVDDGFAPIKVNAGAGTATNLSADRLDGLDSSDFVRAEGLLAVHASGEQTEGLSPGGVVVRAVALTAPSDGTVIAMSSAVTTQSVGGDGTTCSLTDGVDVDFTHAQGWTNGVGDRANLAGTRGFDVSAGQHLTVNLVCRDTAGIGTVQDSAITAIFIPAG
jgi:hypothetical protein